MPVVSPSRYPTSSSLSLSGGSYRSPLSSLDKPYRSSTYVSSTVRSTIGDRTTEYRTRYSDIDGQRERKSSITEYSRGSRAPSVTESESGVSRYRSDRSESRSRDLSSARSDRATESYRNPAVTAARRNVASTALLASSAADLYNKYSPSNYIPLVQRLSGNSYDISRSKSISSDIGRPPASESRLSRRARNSVAVPTLVERRPVPKRSTSQGHREHSPSPSYTRRVNGKERDPNGNDVQPSVAEIRKRFDQNMAVTKLPANDSRYARNSAENYLNQLKNCQNGTSNYAKPIPKDDQPAPVHLPTDKTKWDSSKTNSESSMSKTMSEPLSLAKPTEKGDMTSSLNGKLPSDRVLAVKSQLDPNNPIGKILEKSTVIKVDAPNYDNVTSIEVPAKEPKIPKHTSNFASYIQISRPIVSGMETTKINGLESPKSTISGAESPKLKINGVQSPKLKMNGIESPKLKISGVESPKLKISGVESPKSNINGVEFPKSNVNSVESPKSNESKQNGDDSLKYIDDDRLVLNDIDSPTAIEAGFENKTFEHENYLKKREEERRPVDEEERKMETSTESTSSDLTEDSTPGTPQASRKDADTELGSTKTTRRSAEREAIINGSHGNGKAKAGLKGLRNIGNTCFMNSVLQCLSNTRPLLEYITRDVPSDVNTSLSPMKGALIKAFATVVKELWRDDDSDVAVNTTALKSQVQKFAPRFMGYSQQDAQEFLRYLLEGLHEDVNRVQVKPKPILTEIDDSLSDTAKANEAWSRYLRMEESRIGDIFMGQLKSTLRCTHCQHDSVTFDPFWDLSLPIPSRTGNLKIQQCLAHFTREEELDGDEKPTCSKCGVRRKCLKWFTVQRFPRVLVLHLKRFSPTERFRGKLSVPVEFPLTGLDMSPYAANRGQEATYNLYAVSNHSGTTYSGHYTAYCKHPYTGEWYEYNDSRVSPISPRGIVSSEAYVLFYEMSGRSS